MAFFDSSFLTFFDQLETHNEREWFNANKKTYEKSVKKPFNAFVDHMIERMRALDPEMMIQAKDAVFRIHRDIRFSADKTPYKTHMSAALSRGGRKDFNSEGIYIQFGAQDAQVYSGCYQPDKDQLLKIRTYMAENPEEFLEAFSDPKFQSHFGEIHGEKNKRLPKELMEAAEKQPILFNKQFYYYHTFPAKILLDEHLDDVLLEYLAAAQPMSQFLQEAMA